MPDTALHTIPDASAEAWHAPPDSIQGTGARTITFTCDSAVARYAFGASAPAGGGGDHGHPFPCPQTTGPTAWDLASGEKLWVFGRAGTKISIDRS